MKNMHYKEQFWKHSVFLSSQIKMSPYLQMMLFYWKLEEKKNQNQNETNHTSPLPPKKEKEKRNQRKNRN